MYANLGTVQADVAGARDENVQLLKSMFNEVEYCISAFCYRRSYNQSLLVFRSGMTELLGKLLPLAAEMLKLPSTQY